MAALEPLISFTVFLSVLALFTAAVASAETKADSSLETFNAKLSANKCASLIDSVYSNSGELEAGEGTECTVKGGKFFFDLNGFEVGTALVNKSTTSFEENGKTKIKVAIRERYER